MNNSITFEQYRGIDLSILTVLTVVSEALTALAASKWFPNELYSLSPMVAMVCIVMMRWSGWAAIPAVLSGLAFCLVTGGTAQQIAVYCAGNCFALIALVWFRAMGKENVAKSIAGTAGFVVTAFVGMLAGRWAVSMIFGAAPGVIVRFFLVDSLSLLFAIAAVFISRRVDGLFEDQKSYLLRTAAEREKEREDEANYYD